MAFGMQKPAPNYSQDFPFWGPWHFSAASIGLLFLSLRQGCKVLRSACLYVCLFVCLSVCLTVCLLAYLKNRASEFHQIFCTCCLWRWLGHVTTAIRYVTLLPVLWMTPCSHIVHRIARIKDDAYVSSNSSGGGTGSEVCRFQPCLVYLVMFSDVYLRL